MTEGYANHGYANYGPICIEPPTLCAMHANELMNYLNAGYENKLILSHEASLHNRDLICMLP